VAGAKVAREGSPGLQLRQALVQSIRDKILQQVSQPVPLQWHTGEIVLDRQKVKRDLLKGMLGLFLSWTPLDRPRPGFSIVLGVPWALRHLLQVNLEFVAKTDISQLCRLHIVFDRVKQKGADEFIAQTKASFPSLPMSFRFHPPVSGRFVELINQSKFYASMNWTLGIGECETRYAIMHDFDLYPLVPNYFTSMVDAMRDRALRFTGVELTHFDELDDSHGLIGTWALGIDVVWLRQNYRPIDCFHAVENINGRRFDLDAFTYIQSTIPQRALVGTVTPEHMAHVRNLVSTYLRFSKGEKFDVVWRLHQMWYMESMCDRKDRLNEVIHLMNEATSSRLRVDSATAEFGETHVTCANVLRDQVLPMENFLFGGPRPEVLAYADAFERFLWRFGRSDTLLNEDGSVRWRPEVAKNEAARPGAVPQA